MSTSTEFASTALRTLCDTAETEIAAVADALDKAQTGWHGAAATLFAERRPAFDQSLNQMSKDLEQVLASVSAACTGEEVAR